MFYSFRHLSFDQMEKYSAHPPSWSIRLHFVSNSSSPPYCSAALVLANAVPRAGPRNKTGHPAPSHPAGTHPAPSHPVLIAYGT